MIICMSFTASSVGGEYNHKLTQSEMPKHNHDISLMAKGSSNWEEQIVKKYGVMIDYTTKNYVIPEEKVNATKVSAFVQAGSSGGDVHHNNVQPYIVTFFWKRIN